MPVWGSEVPACFQFHYLIWYNRTERPESLKDMQKQNKKGQSWVLKAYRLIPDSVFYRNKALLPLRTTSLLWNPMGRCYCLSFGTYYLLFYSAIYLPVIYFMKHVLSSQSVWNGDHALWLCGYHSFPVVPLLRKHWQNWTDILVGSSVISNRNMILADTSKTK